ncbi:hypothetical protein Leryth_010878 [Lithospermum erythrorhizon]|nr:hypothetical protein Leryth_010878 [Lithospermum erythrorhizon]
MKKKVVVANPIFIGSLHYTLLKDKRKKLQKSNDVDGSSNTTEDRIITRKRHLRQEDINIRYTNREHHERVLAFENPTIVSTQEGPKHVQRFTCSRQRKYQFLGSRKAARHIIIQRIDLKSELELEELPVDQSITISKELVETGDKKTYTVSDHKGM